MAETKACNLTEKEIFDLIALHGNSLNNIGVDTSELVERINYLHKRLKSFNEPAKEPVDKSPLDVAADNAVKGWT